MNSIIHKLQIRLTEEDLTYIKKHSANYCSMSHYICSAAKEHSDPSTIRQLQLIEALRHFYHINNYALSQVSGNLNNAVKRAKELALSDHLTQTYISDVSFPKSSIPTSS